MGTRAVRGAVAVAGSLVLVVVGSGCGAAPHSDDAHGSSVGPVGKRVGGIPTAQDLYRADGAVGSPSDYQADVDVLERQCRNGAAVPFTVDAAGQTMGGRGTRLKLMDAVVRRLGGRTGVDCVQALIDAQSGTPIVITAKPAS